MYNRVAAFPTSLNALNNNNNNNLYCALDTKEG